MKMRWITIILLVLTLSLVSCSGQSPASSSSGQDQPAAAAAKVDPTEVPPTVVPPTPVPPTKVPPTEVPPTLVPEEDEDEGATEGEALAGDDIFSLSDVSDLANLDSYRASHQISWTEENGESGQTNMLLEVVKDPPAQHMVIEDEEEGVVTEFIMVDGATYLSNDGEWIAMQTNAEEMLSQTGWWSAATDLTSSGMGKFVGNETVNGVKTKHYRSTEKDLNSQLAMGQEVEKVTLDVWLEPKENIFVKYIVEWEGVADEEMGRGTFRMESNLIEYNKPIKIEAPAGVDKPATPEDIPVMEGAVELTIMGGMTSYQVAATQDDVVLFYKEQMVTNGWAAEQSFMPTMTAFTKGDRTATIIVSEDSEGIISVMIMTE